MASSAVPNTPPARVCRWFGGKQAALSLRFDDAHPTHIEVGVPALNEFGLIGTFLVNPGNDSYRKYQSVWEGAVLQQGHELADHTWNHRGATTDADAEQQIGAPAEALRRLQPEHPQIMFEPGGATRWFQRKPFEFFDAKYHLYDVNDTVHFSRNVMSCSEVYSFFSVDAFRTRLEEVIAQGEWFQPHFHQLDETGHLRITPPIFRRVLAVAHAHAGDVWQAGMSAIGAYQEERDNAAVWPQVRDDDTLVLDLTCATDPNLFTQPLTLEVDLPAGVTATVTDAVGQTVPARPEAAGTARVLRFEVPPVDARFTVRASGIGAAARPRVPEIQTAVAHPYVFFSAADVPALLARNSDPLAKSLYDHLIEDADRFLTAPLPEPYGSGAHESWPRMGRELYPIDALAFAYALTGKRAYAEAALPRLEMVSGADWWYAEHSEMLINAAALRTMGTAYDWLYGALTEAQRARLRTTMVEHGIKPILAATESSDWWTAWYHCNWGQVIYGEFGVAALALLGDEPEAAEWVRLAQRKNWHYLHSLNPDGTWGESATYAAYAWSRALMFMDPLRRVTGQDAFTSDRLPKLPNWFVGLLAPGNDDFVPFSNCWNGSTGSIAGVLFRLAREYHDGHAQFAAYQAAERHGADLFAYLWYDPAAQATPLSDLPLDTLFRDLDWAFLRSSREDPQATLFGLKGGHKEWDHSHHDTNSFVLYAYGRPLLIDLFYPHDIWGVKTEAHNTVMVNGHEQAGRVNVAGGRDDPDHRGTIAELVDTPWYARLVGDASMAYAPEDLSSFVREVMYLRHAGADTPPDYVVLFDDLVSPQPSQIDWLLHTYGQVQTGEHGLTLTEHEAAVDVTLVSPTPFTSAVKETNLKDIQTPSPFEGAATVKTIALRPAEQTARTFFLSVLAPRVASSPAAVSVAPVQADNVLGADVTANGLRDRVLFALDAPQMKAAGVEAVGRSALVRTAGDRLVGAALHKGQRLVADGVLLFETDNAGHAVLTFTPDGVEATLDLYNPTWVKLHVSTRPTRVLVNGKEQAFSYEDGCVKLNHTGPHQVRAFLR